MIADLHCHSNFSDGVLSPAELFEKASAAGIELLALTDHDTLDGTIELQELVSKTHTSMTIINGIEISTRWKKFDIHIVGLNINLNNEDLNELIIQQTNSRINRSHQIAESLTTLGIENVLEKVRMIAGHDRIARPHFAQLLINEGKATTMQTAFKRFLTPGKIAYFATPWVDIPQAIDVIKKAQGRAVLAHPMKYKLTKTKLNELIDHFKEAGGEALEIISGECNSKDIQEMKDLCKRYQLLSSTGSDYHSHLSRISLGKQQQLPLDCKPIWHDWYKSTLTTNILNGD